MDMKIAVTALGQNPAYLKRLRHYAWCKLMMATTTEFEDKWFAVVERLERLLRIAERSAA